MNFVFDANKMYLSALVKSNLRMDPAILGEELNSDFNIKNLEFN